MMVSLSPKQQAYANFNVTTDLTKVIRELRMSLKKLNEQIEGYKEERNARRLERALKDDKWKTVLLSTAGSILSGNINADLSNCLPQLDGNINFQFPRFSGSTVINCSETGKLQMTQNYFYSLGSVSGSAFGKRIGEFGPQGSGSHENMIANLTKSRQKKKDETSKDALRIAQELGEDISNGADVRDMEGRRKESEYATSLTGQNNVLLIEKLSGIQKWGRYTAPLFTAKAGSVSTKEVTKAPLYLNSEGQVIDKKTFFAGFFKENPSFFEKNPDLFAHAPELIAQNPHILAQHPDRIEKLAKYLENKPKLQVQVARAWLPYPQLHMLYTEVVPKPNKNWGQSFAERKEAKK